MLALRHLFPLVLLMACGLPAEAQRADAIQGDDLLRENVELDRAGREARDLRVSFSAGAAQRGRALLLEAQANPEAPRDLALLAGALMSLGGGGDPKDLELLERYAEAGKLSLRRAALHAIGDMGIQGFGVLDRLFGGHLVGTEEVAILALIHMDQGSRVEPRVALQRALDACNDSRPGVSNAALFLRDYALGGPAPAALPALDAYYDLRWSAACAFGFVDGLRWRDLKLGALLGDVEYLNRFVLSLAGQLDKTILVSHVIELMAYPHGPGCAAGIIEGLPGVLATLYVEAGWRPASIDEWEEVIHALRLRDRITGYEALLQDALRIIPSAQGLDAMREQAALMLIEAGQEVPLEWVNAAIRSKDRQLQSKLLALGGGSNNESMRAYARELLESTESPAMAIRAQLALARMGEEAARLEVAKLVRESRSNVRLMVLEAMQEVSHDPLIRNWLLELVAGLELGVDERLALTFALAWGAPSSAQREVLRAALRSGRGDQRSRLRVLDLLLKEPGPEDMALFEELLPVEGELEINLRLARGLAEKRDNHTLEAIRHVLWGGQWNLSVMAGGISNQMLGTSFLMDELATPPGDASDHHLRSVGFALGEWAGLSAVEELARTHTARDPSLQGAYLGALSSSGQ